MKICLIAEGCYPYVAGGVSSWIQMLIRGLSHHEFIIVAIGAEKKLRGQYKYELPKNVTAVHEYFLDEYLDSEKRKPVRRKLTGAQRQAVLELLRGRLENWIELFTLFSPESDYKANDFLVSRDFLDLIMELAEEEYENIPFKDTFWTVRSMLIPALNLLRCPVPEADLYHSVSTGYAGLVGARFKAVTGKPFLVTEHGIYTREREEEILKADWVSTYFKKTWISFFTSLSRAAYREADRILSLFYGARHIQIELGAPEEKCRVIPNGISIERFSHIPPVSLDPHPLAIGAVIRVVPIKDIKTMLYSFEFVKSKRPDAVLYLIGPYDEDPRYYQECLELISALSLKDVIFTGRVNVAEWYEKLDLVILTSVSEGQPFVLLEAMAARRPVLSTNVGSCREIIEGFPDEYGPCGEIAPVMNPSGIAHGILRIASSPEHMRGLAENGYRRVCSYYRDTDFLNSYDELYQEVRTEWQESVLN